MELDDLKDLWKKSQINKTTNTDIMDLIQHKSYGPLAAMRSTFLKQIRLMVLMPVILILANANNIPGVLTSFMFWSYVVFCIIVILFSFYNYRIVRRMEIADGMVRSNLEQQIYILEKRMNWSIVGLRFVLLYFILLTEVLPYFQHYRMLDHWHSFHPLVRFGSYAVLLVTQYFLSRVIWERKFGTHLRRLKELVNELK